jgi:hypothetical protein
MLQCDDSRFPSKTMEVETAENLKADKAGSQI